MEQLAIRENRLPGRTVEQRFEAAKKFGLNGVEIMADHLREHMVTYAEALANTGMKIAAIHMGRHAGYLSPDMAERETTIGYLREMIAAAADLEAPQVVLVPIWRDSSRMPDLTPYRSAMELEAEMLVWMLRVVSDLVAAFGVKLCLQPVNYYETHFMQSLQQASHFCAEVDHHPDIKIAPDTFHMNLVEDDIEAALRAFGTHMGTLYLCDSNGRLPGLGLLDYKPIAQSINELAYEGWLILNTHHPGITPDDIARDLPVSIKTLKSAGFQLA